MTWDEYNQRLTDLETTLQTRKNNAQAAFEATLAQYGEPVVPYRYPHPSEQRGTTRPQPQAQKVGPPQVAAKQPAQAKAEAPALPPEIASRIPEGKRVRLRNRVTGQVEIWQRLGGKLTRVK